jgi:hypothetical protein
MKQFLGLDYEVCSPKFNIKPPDGKIDDEILADVEKKVIQMIGNYTHKEWEAAQKFLKHQGHVNHVLEEMKVSCPSRPKPTAPGKKMQPPGNIGFEPAEISKKGKMGKAIATMEGTSKPAKATEVLAQRKAEDAKTTLPPVAEKPSKLMKIGENLVRRKTEAAKVAVAEKEKKTVQDVAPTTGLEKKTSSKRRAPDDTKKNKGIRIKKKQLEVAKPQAKKLQIDPSSDKDETEDVLATLRIELMGAYPLKDKEPQEPKDQPETTPVDPNLAEIEVRTERAQVYFSATCSPRECLKQTPEAEAAGKKF